MFGMSRVVKSITVILRYKHLTEILIGGLLKSHLSYFLSFNNSINSRRCCLYFVGEWSVLFSSILKWLSVLIVVTSNPGGNILCVFATGMCVVKSSLYRSLQEIRDCMHVHGPVHIEKYLLMPGHGYYYLVDILSTRMKPVSPTDGWVINFRLEKPEGCGF